MKLRPEVERADAFHVGGRAFVQRHAAEARDGSGDLAGGARVGDGQRRILHDEGRRAQKWVLLQLDHGHHAALQGGGLASGGQLALHLGGHFNQGRIGIAGGVGDKGEPEEVAQGGRAEEAAQVDGDVQVDGPAPVAGGHRGAHGADDRRDEVGGDADSGVFGGGMHGAGR